MSSIKANEKKVVGMFMKHGFMCALIVKYGLVCFDIHIYVSLRLGFFFIKRMRFIDP